MRRISCMAAAAPIAVSIALAAPAADRTIVAFGDSITYGKGSAANGPRSGYPAYLGGILAHNCPGTTFSLVNAGVSGETTSGGLARLGRVLDAYRPDIVLIMEGTNDIALGVPFGVIRDNLARMAAIAAARGVTPVVGTVIPPHPALCRAQYARTARFYSGGYIQDACASRGVRCADLWAAFHAVPGFGNALFNPASPEHPNSAGHAYVMAPAWYDALAPVLGVPLASEGPSLSLAGGEEGVARGEALHGRYELAPGDDLVRNALDCYAAVMAPGGRFAFLDSRGALSGGAPLLARAIPRDRATRSGPLPPILIPRGAPAGRYTLFLAAVRILHDPLDPAARTALAELPFDVR